MRKLKLDILQKGLPGITPIMGAYYMEAALADLINKNKAEKPIKSIKQILKLEGVFADINSKANEIIIEDSKQQQAFSVIVPRKILLEIIQKYWSKKVQIQARKTLHGLIVLEEIKPAA